MQFEKLSVCLMVPFIYEKSCYAGLCQEETSGIQEDFCLKTISAPRLNDFGNTWLTAEDGMVKCYECRPKSRPKMGLHKNESALYYFYKDLPQVKFRIGSVQVWFFRSGRAFLTIPVTAENVTAEQALDLKNFLTDIRAGKKITYSIKLAKDLEVKPVITWKECIRGRKNLLYEQTEPEKRQELTGCIKILQPLQAEVCGNDTCNKAYAMTYGLADKVSDLCLDEYLEAFRENQKSSADLADRIDTKYKYEIVKHLLWVFSKRGISVIGDYETADKADKKGGSNRVFLKDFWENSMMLNYRILYLYYLSTYLEYVALQGACVMAKKNPGQYIDRELIQAVADLDRRFQELSTEERINCIFLDYLCRNVWNLQTKVRELLGELPWLRNHCHCDIFISYRREGGFYPARLLSAVLQQNGKTPYMDMERLQIGKEFDEQLYQAIDQCEFFISVLSPGSLDRCCEEDDWVKKEILYALQKQKKILPIMLDEFEYPESGMPEELKTFCKKHAMRATIQTFENFLLSLMKKLQQMSCNDSM